MGRILPLCSLQRINTTVVECRHTDKTLCPVALVLLLLCLYCFELLFLKGITNITFYQSFFIFIQRNKTEFAMWTIINSVPPLNVRKGFPACEGKAREA